mmetsp:Transcript_2128/g.2441  ORF Transcript_2128/g.2441 Transcript_2128/m.2441 type:complete len:240 (-) Transcript_2128:99-818(-)
MLAQRLRLFGVANLRRISLAKSTRSLHCLSSTFPTSAIKKTSFGNLKQHTKSMSTFLEALKEEIAEAEEDGLLVPIDIDELLSESPFDLLSAKNDEGHIVLKNGNAIVTFDPVEFEHSGASESAVPMVVTLSHDQQQLALSCIARMHEDEDEADSGEIEIEQVVLEPLGGSGVNKAEPYSPAIGELSDEMKTSMFEYLHSKGVDDAFAASVVAIASKTEEQMYGNWLKDLQSFVEKEDA